MAVVVLPAGTIHPFSLESMGLDFSAIGTQMDDAVSAVWPAANRALFFPFVLPSAITATLMFVYNGATASGNIDVGIYDANQVLRVSSGSTAQAGTTALQTFNITDTVLVPGLYYLAIAKDDITGTTFRVAPGARSQALSGGNQQASAFALPSTATMVQSATSYVPLFGLSVKTVV